jgi:histidinol-phosphate aminotransferase
MNASATDLMTQWIRPQVRALSAYHVPEVGKLIKLDAMENPYTWPKPLVDEWLEVLRGVSLNRYPDPQARDLKARLRATLQVPAGIDIMLGNGSDELIQIIAMAVAAPGRTVLSPEPSFSMYRMIAAFVGLEFVSVPLHANDYGLDMPALRAAIIKHRPAVVFVSHPNNPTGNLFDEQQVCELIELSPGLVVVDEAYNAFAGSTFMPHLARYGNLLVLRTLSKMGLAGLRMGVLAGSPVWLNELDKIRLPYNINILTQASAEFALRHYDVLEAQAARLRENREQLLAALGVLNGVTVYPSRANFILFRVPAGRAPEIFESIKAQGVLIKSMHGASPLLADCLRVTVSTPEENQAFLTALQQALAQAL